MRVHDSGSAALLRKKSTVSNRLEIKIEHETFVSIDLGCINSNETRFRRPQCCPACCEYLNLSATAIFPAWQRRSVKLAKAVRHAHQAPLNAQACLQFAKAAIGAAPTSFVGCWAMLTSISRGWFADFPVMLLVSGGARFSARGIGTFSEML